MRKLFLTSLIVCYLSFFSFAQSSAEWKVFTPENEEFSVESLELTLSTFNPQPVSSNSDITKLNHRNSVNFFSNNIFMNDLDLRVYSRNAESSNGIYYYIFSENKDNSILPKLLNNEHLHILLSKIAINYNAKIENLLFGKIKAKLLKFIDSEGFYQIILIAETEKRRYIFHTITEKVDSYEVKRFFSSIKLKNKVYKNKLNLSYSPSKKTDSISIYEIPLNPKREISGSDFGGISSEPKTKSQSASLKIYSKPKAFYTDLARCYQIQGSVTLKTSFLENGKIGNIESIKKLPFGLTNSAVEALKLIKFEPQIENGIKVAVTKQIQYTFTLY